jgi:hypothetical protein
MSRGRKPGFVMPEEHRTKIANSKILNRLIDHVMGEVEMTSTQVTAAIALMRKVMPDLSSTDINADVVHHMVARMPVEPASVEEWEKRYLPNTREH